MDHAALAYASSLAYVENAQEDLKDIKSLVFDTFTGPSDEWVKSEFLQAILAVEDNLRKATTQ